MTGVGPGRPGVALADLTTLGLGGPARMLVVATTERELVDVVAAADTEGEPVLVVGGGSNLVVGDGGFAGTVVQVATRGERVRTARPGWVEVTVAAGVRWDEFVARSVAEGWSGLEVLSGIPGLVGATPVQNVGAYGREVEQAIIAIRAYDRVTAAVTVLARHQCGFGYRTSRLRAHHAPTGRYVVLDVMFELRRQRPSAGIAYAELARRLEVPLGTCVPAEQVRAAVLELRRAKGMVLDPADPDTRSVGSFFTNPVLDPVPAARLPAPAPRWPMPDGRVKTSAAWLIEQVGIHPGHGPGPVRVSTIYTT